MLLKGLFLLKHSSLRIRFVGLLSQNPTQLDSSLLLMPSEIKGSHRMPTVLLVLSSASLSI